MNPPQPEAYEFGWAPFIHAKIWLDSQPLIPRTETEYWVNEAIQDIKKTRKKNLKVLDLCAGSGCIGVAVAMEIPGAQVDFAELDPKHHETIRKNIKENDIDPSRARIFGGDLFENIEEKHDIIFANPPYIDMNLGRVEESVLAHEPRLALDGGREGMEIIERILAEMPAYLNAGGTLYLEHEPEHVEMLAKHPLYQGSHPDQFGTLRFSCFMV